MESATEVVDLVVRGGLAVFLILVLVGGSRRWWVFGHVFTAMEAERNKLQRQNDELLSALIRREIEDHTQPMEDMRRD